MSGLSVVPAPDLVEISERFSAFVKLQQQAAHHARIGAIVSLFTNEEIHLLCEMSRLNIGDVLDLRRLGLLDPDEGWTGGPIPKEKPSPDTDRASLVTGGG